MREARDKMREARGERQEARGERQEEEEGAGCVLKIEDGCLNMDDLPPSVCVNCKGHACPPVRQEKIGRWLFDMRNLYARSMLAPRKVKAVSQAER